MVDHRVQEHGKPLSEQIQEAHEEVIIVRVKGGGNTTVMPDDPDDAQFLYVDSEEEKEYAEYLRDSKDFGYTTIRTMLHGRKEWKQYREAQNQQ